MYTLLFYSFYVVRKFKITESLFIRLDKSVIFCYNKAIADEDKTL